MRGQERPLEEGGTASVADEGPGLKGPCKEVEAWHCKESKEVISESAAQLQQRPQSFGEQHSGVEPAGA